MTRKLLSSRKDLNFMAWAHCFLFILFSSFIGILIFTISRFLLIFVNGGYSIFYQSQEIIQAFHLGIWYDAKTIATLYITFYVLSLLALALPNKLLFWYSKVPLKICSFVVLSLCVFFSIVNFYYYKYFNSHIDIRFFGIIGGDKNAVWTSIWNDYPVVRASIFLIVSFVFLYKTLQVIQNKIQQNEYCAGLFVRSIIILSSLIMFVFFARGSLGKFPLREQQSVFSENNLLNQSTVNGVGALYYAYHRKQHEIKPVIVTNEQGRKAYNLYFNKKLKPQEFSFDSLYTHTHHSDYLENESPNVVFAQMESMGRHFLLMQNKSNNLVGRLGNRLKSDMIFYNFLSGANGTDGSLALLLFNSPISFVFEISGQKAFEYSIAKPYKEKGYETVFVTSGDIGWSNLETALRNQYFDHVYGKTEILRKYPKAEQEPWGVYDGYTFNYVYNLLKQAKKKNKKLFVFILTVSNHPPYSVPYDYRPYVTTVTDNLPDRLKMSKVKVKQVLEAYQYANDALGGFVDGVSKSNFGKKTIIAASGDHNIHELLQGGYPNYKEYGLQYEVPFFLYVPESYMKKNGYVYKPNRIGSHKDIFPTLFNLSLSDAKYLNFGNNILAKDSEYKHNLDFSFGYNLNIALLDEGLITDGHNSLFYHWTGPQRTKVEKGEMLTLKNKKILDRIKAYKYLLFWQYEKQLEMANIK